MKHRIGFVSNSSSSSFLAIGYSLDKDVLKDAYGVNDIREIEIKIMRSLLDNDDMLEKQSQKDYKKSFDQLDNDEKLEVLWDLKYSDKIDDDLLIGDNDEEGVPRGTFFVGKRLKVFSEYGDDIMSITEFSELNLNVKKFAEAAKESGLNLDETEPVILTGTMLT